MKAPVIVLLFFIPILARSQDTSRAARPADTSRSTRRTDSSLTSPKADTTHKIDSTRRAVARTASDSTHYADTVVYHYSYSGTGTINHTNTLTSYVFSNSLNFSALKKSSTVSFSNNWLYGRQSGNLTNNDFTSTGDISLYKTLRHFYYWGLITYNTSLSLQINHLIQSGVGAGYNLIDKKKASLILSDGVLYEKGDLYDIVYGSPNGDVTQRDRYQGVRNSFRLKFRFVIHDNITFEGAEFIQNSFVHWDNYILKLSGSASVKLYKWLNLTTAVLYNKFTRTRSENTLLTFGLTITR